MSPHLFLTDRSVDHVHVSVGAPLGGANSRGGRPSYLWQLPLIRAHTAALQITSPTHDHRSEASIPPKHLILNVMSAPAQFPNRFHNDLEILLVIPQEIEQSMLFCHSSLVSPNNATEHGCSQKPLMFVPNRDCCTMQTSKKGWPRLRGKRHLKSSFVSVCFARFWILIVLPLSRPPVPCT